MFFKKPDLIRSVYEKDCDSIDMALRSGIDINQADDDGRTALMHAVLDDEADLAVVRFLINRGANVTLHDREQRWTALHFAARDQQAPVVEALLDAGAEIDATDSFGNTALWRAIMNHDADFDVIRVLLRHGANPDKKNLKGVSPRLLAERLGRPEITAQFD